MIFGTVTRVLSARARESLDCSLDLTSFGPCDRKRRRHAPTMGGMAAAEGFLPNSPGTQSGELFSRVNVGRISGLIVDQVRSLIREGQLSAGDRLPAERE